MYNSLEEEVINQLDRIRELEKKKEFSEAQTERNKMESILRGTGIDLKDIEDRMEVIYV